MKRNFLIVGSGLSGAIAANFLANQMDSKVLIIDKRSHIGGNCYTEKDPSTKITIHKYGPHIFNSPNSRVINFWKKFVELKPYTHSVKAIIPKQGVYQLPINLHTINQFFHQTFSPSEAKAFLAERAMPIPNPANFEEQALSMLGVELYEAFFKGYTQKQWGVEPKQLPASILKRIPVRFNYSDSYYHSSYSAIPVNGYTELFENLLKHKNITLKLGVEYSPSMNNSFTHVFYSGGIDSYFSYKYGPLGYRSVFWEDHITEGDFQGASQINYPTMTLPYTRIIEHKYFMPWTSISKSIYSYEYSKETTLTDEPYYPKRLDSDLLTLRQYHSLAHNEENVTFMGRLGTYRYLDMWKVTLETLELMDLAHLAYSSGSPFPLFSFDPL
ncbi:NAD(P)-binding protein [bacterium]|nr:NAD(P)-binding protein [bacterium]